MIRSCIADWARRAPDKVAIVYNGQRLSYDQFDRVIRAINDQLRRQDCGGPGIAIVAIRNWLQFWCASLALRSRGLTTLCLPSLEAIRSLALPHIVCIAVSQAEPWDGLAEHCRQAQVPLIDIPTEFGSESPDDDARVPPGGHILMTSGTTGTAKLVFIDPASEAGFLRHRQALLGLDRDSVFNIFDFPPWSGAGYKSPISTWLAGGCVIMQRGGPLHLGLLQKGQTHAVLTPSKLTTILDAPPAAFPRHDALRLSIIGGAAYRAQVDAAKLRITPHIYNRLSATETSIFGFTRLDGPDDYRWHARVPGRPVEIVDRNGRSVPVGEVGLLRVSTADGPYSYLGDAHTTSAFFRDGFFYTGDLAVARADGRFALQGRETDVMNIQGKKIAPLPIEARLVEIFGLSGVCLMSYPNEFGEEGLIVVIEGDMSPDTKAVEDSLRARLGSRIWIRFHYLDRLPRNDMGKLMRAEVKAKFAAAGHE